MRVPLMRVVLGAAMLCGIVLAADAPAFKSKAVKYAKIPLSADGAKAVVLAFDESKGTGEGYDCIQVIPVGFKQATQTLVAKDNGQNNAKMPAGTSFVRNSFDPIELAPLAKAAGVPTLAVEKIVLTFFRQRYPGVTNEGFQANFSSQKEEGADKWQCMVMSQVKTADSQADAPAIAVVEKPGLQLTARQAKGKQDVEIGVSTVLGEMNAYLTKNGKTPEVTVSVKAENGDVVKKEVGDANKFSFG